MANDEDLARIQQGVDVWNVWRQEHPPHLSEVDLCGADLHRADLRKAELSLADLRKADLDEADLMGANFIGANLGGANLGGAILGDANLSGANLSGANSRWAYLHWANLHGADLSGLDLGEAIICETMFANVDLSATKGLHICRHDGPSILDHRTLQRSGSLPLAFLRGCGLPDRLIDYLPSLLEEAIQYYSCFISYSSKDQSFADRPVRIDEEVMKTGEPWAVKLRDQRNIGDFRQWKDHDAYQQAFSRVLRDLKATPG